MIRLSLFASACLALAACGVGGSADNEAAKVCNTMLAGDPEIVEDLAEDGDTVETYCACYATLLAERPEDAQARILDVTNVVADIRAEQELGLEDAAMHLMEDFIEDGSSPTYGVTRDSFEATGSYIAGLGPQAGSDMLLGQAAGAYIAGLNS